jgi:hypothetical protein
MGIDTRIGRDPCVRLRESRRDIQQLTEQLHGSPSDGAFPRSMLMRALTGSKRGAWIGSAALILGLARPSWAWRAARLVALPLARRYLLPMLFK